MRVAPPILLLDEERMQLERWSRGRSAEHRLVMRARVVLAAARGLTNQEVAVELDASEDFVGKWRGRFQRLRLAGIEKEAPRPRESVIPASTVDEIVRVTLHEKPRGATHWSTRSLATRMDVSHMTVDRVWKMHNLKPHLTRSVKLSTDSRYVEKLVDVVGLYMNPPEKAVVLCVDEKPQVQALERAQTILPLRAGLPEGRSYDYRRNGTIDLFAALNTLDGTVITEFHHRHRSQEFIQFLRTIDSHVEPGLDIHVVLDNLKVHDSAPVKLWLARHPRFKFHFIPTGSSWLNGVEQWFSQLTQKQLRRGSFASVRQLIQAIREFVAAYATTARPFTWTKPAEQLLRGRINGRTSVTGH
jgi:transposase